MEMKEVVFTWSDCADEFKKGKGTGWRKQYRQNAPPKAGRRQKDATEMRSCVPQVGSSHPCEMGSCAPQAGSSHPCNPAGMQGVWRHVRHDG
ncbi:hypothetical protein CR513_59937, partial [Mucuna pruriens]